MIIKNQINLSKIKNDEKCYYNKKIPILRYRIR